MQAEPHGISPEMDAVLAAEIPAASVFLRLGFCVLSARLNNGATSGPAGNQTGCAYDPRRSELNTVSQKTAKAIDHGEWPTLRAADR